MSVPVTAIGDRVAVAGYGPGLIREITSDGIAQVVLEQGDEVGVPIASLATATSFFTFDCECGSEQSIDRIEPGQAAVLECENCGESWTIVLPSLELYKTAEYEPIWEHTGQ